MPSCEGLDHPALDPLVLAMSVSWKGTVQQYAGRQSTPARPTCESSANRHRKRAVSVVFPAFGETITSNIWRRIPMGIAGLEGVGSPSKLRFKIAELQVGEKA